MLTAHQITEQQKQRKIKKLVWNMICSASDENVSPFMTEEYDQLYRLGWKFLHYKSTNDWLSALPIEEQIMFALFIYHSLP